MKENNQNIVWGIIGCGDVAEVKSGPAFQKCNNSQLLAVMRRDSQKAQDFAKRHHVPFWYNKATDLLANKEINAVYIATPPATHLELAVKSLEAGKNVYLEKPMTISATEAETLSEAVKITGKKLVVAHYRRQLPMFLRVKEWLQDNKIGQPQMAELKFFRHQENLQNTNWRLDPAVSGGTFFYDIAPHQLDLLYYFFGSYQKVSGNSFHHKSNSEFTDIVTGLIDFDNGLQFSGKWNFNACKTEQIDECNIYGSKGKITFSTFGNEIVLTIGTSKTIEKFTHPQHIQQPFIQKTVDYFLGKTENPCNVDEGKKIIEIMDKFTKK